MSATSRVIAVAVVAMGCNRPLYREPQDIEVRLHATSYDGDEVASVTMHLPPTDARCDKREEAYLSAVLGPYPMRRDVLEGPEEKAGGCPGTVRYLGVSPDLSSGEVALQLYSEDVGVDHTLVIDVPPSLTHLTTDDSPVLLQAGGTHAFTLPRTPDGTMHRARLGPVGGRDRRASSYVADVRVSGSTATLEVPPQAEPGDYALLLRVDVPADIEDCPYSACTAWVASRFFAHVTVQ